MAFDTIRYSPPQGKQLKLKQQAFLAVSEDTSTRDDVRSFASATLLQLKWVPSSSSRDSRLS